MARSDGRLWSVVCAAPAAFLFCFGYERANLGRRVLCAGVRFQLSALHGDDLPRLPSRRRLPQISCLYGSHHGTIGVDGAVVARVAADSAVGFHDLPDLEPMALQRTELRPVHDVRAARGSATGEGRAARFVWCVCGFVSRIVSGISYRAVVRPAVFVAGNSGGGEPLGAGAAVTGIRCAFGFRAIAFGAGDGMAKTGSVADFIFYAVFVVPAAGGHLADSWHRDSAEPVQHGRAGDHALGAISLDYELLCAPRSF